MPSDQHLVISNEGSTATILKGSTSWEVTARRVQHVEITIRSAPAIEYGFPLEAVHDAANTIAVDCAHDEDSTNISAAPDDAPPIHTDRASIPPAEASADVRGRAPVDQFPTREQHRRVVRSWPITHREMGWVAPPRKLATDLYTHLLATSAKSAERKDSPLLSPAISACLAYHGHISAPRKLWIEGLLRNVGNVMARELTPDGDELYALLLRVHQGHSGRAHISPTSMRKQIAKSYVMQPGERFYDAWVAECPGCSWPPRGPGFDEVTIDANGLPFIALFAR